MSTTLAILTPQIAAADDQNAFLLPLGISIFTMVPFLIYQQALKPKPRTGNIYEYVATVLILIKSTCLYPSETN